MIATVHIWSTGDSSGDGGGTADVGFVGTFAGFSRDIVGGESGSALRPTGAGYRAIP